MISLIVACTSTGGIGYQNTIPWMGYFPEDMKFFRETTSNNVVVMGNNTWKSIPTEYRPLSNRHNVVCASQREDIHQGANTLILPREDVDLCSRIQTLSQLHSNKEIFIIGGSMIYEETLPIVQRMYITRIPGEYTCDSFFNPDLSTFELSKTIKLSGSSSSVMVEVYDRK